MASSQTDTGIIIVGAGLCGLACGHLLTQAGRAVRIVEARNKPGGRVRSVFDTATGNYLADLGPTWIWPAYQPRVNHWVELLGLEVFPQYDSGKAVLDYGPETPPGFTALPGQDGNVRLAGGPQALIDGLMARLPEGSVITGSPVTSVSVTGRDVLVTIDDDADRVLTCSHLIVTAPPRIAAGTIRWQPTLSPALHEAMTRTPTWMAPHAKVVALYDRPFWRERGLSGRIASQAGPIVEGHDHSGPDGSPAAIFGFIGWPYGQRAQAGSRLTSLVEAQLERCFGPRALRPRSIHIEDWASDSHVTAPRDLAGPVSHPERRPGILRAPHGNGRLWFAGAETATRSPGLIEGAFDAAERVAETLIAG